jgi:CRP-like cAMP-binding protein
MNYFYELKPSAESIRMSFQNCNTIQYLKDEFLFHAGDEPKSLDLLVEGKVQIFKVDSNFNEITLNFFDAVSLIAEWAVLNRIPYPASSRFAMDSKVIRMPLPEFKERLQKDVVLNQLIVYFLNQKIHTLNNTIDIGLTMDASQRMAHFLYNLPENYLNLKQNQIASMICLRPETLSRVIKQMKSEGIIDTDKGKINILSREKLKKYLNS